MMNRNPVSAAAEVRRMTLLRDEVLTKHGARIVDLAKRWSHISHGPRRYDLLAESEECSVWLLGWRTGEETVDHHVDATPIHGHAESSALITCLFGAVENDEYVLPNGCDELQRRAGAIGASLPYRVLPSTLASRQQLYLPRYAVHDMHARTSASAGFSLTCHVYVPRLSRMTYFLQDAESGKLMFFDVWNEGAKAR